MHSVFRGRLWLSGLLVCSAACSSTRDDSPSTHPELDDPHEFVSAEGYAGQTSQNTADAGLAASAPESSSDAKSSARTVEEGDIYRALGPGRLLNLNPYRGLQVIDIADVSKPSVIGRLRESGQPVEMYVVGQRALVLLNDWTGYYGSRTDVAVEHRTGGLVLSVDLTDPTAPRVTDREFVPGSILTSRLTRQGERAALYVAATSYDCSSSPQDPGACPSTVVKSIDASTADLVPRTTLNLGGYVSALQATPDALIVARTNWNVDQRSVVSLVDIRDLEGRMEEGAQTQIAGHVASKFNLDLRDGVLRVVSGARRWPVSDNSNHVETFAAGDRSTLTPLAHCTFGDGQQLFATLFMQDRAFFVTYLRQDPFHAFALGANGSCEERTEFVVSGWNDFFRPVLDNRRLIGIGSNDQGGRTMAVSLYDVTNLDNPTPLVARKEVEAQHSSSEASVDDKAFSVIEGAVDLVATDDPSARETGLVLLPFYSYGSTTEQRRAGVQIYTFGERTISRRGFLNHGQPVMRSFQPAAQLTANLSAESLSLFDTRDPSAPVEQGRVELAPSYSDVLDYGGFLARVRDTRSAYSGWWSADTTPPPAYVELISKNDDPDTATPIASIEIAAGARTFRVGALLIVISTTSSYDSVGKGTHHSVLKVYDLHEPAQPTLLSSLESDRLLPAYGYGWGRYYGLGFGAGFGMCGTMDGSFYDDFSRVLPNALVLGRNLPQQQSLGSYEFCQRSTNLTPSCAYEDSTSDCTWEQGYESCERKIDSDQRVCTSSFYRCSRVGGETACTDLATAPATLSPEYCYTHERYRYWQSMELDVLDLRDPRAPKLTAVNFAPEEEALGLVQSQNSVYFAFKRPHTMAKDSRPFAKHYFREVNLSDPAQPAVGAPVNVPGQLLAVAGTRLFTRDLRWGEKTAETWLHVLQRENERATLVTSQSFTGRDVTHALVDDSGHVFVTHRQLNSPGVYAYSNTPSFDLLTIFGAADLAKQGETTLDAWSDLTQAVDGRLLFTVPGGMLVVNAQTPAAPYAQAYFPYQGYQRKISYDGQSILVAGGPYGLYRLDATTHNLLAR